MQKRCNAPEDHILFYGQLLDDTTTYAYEGGK
jgi:hypothetical protein